MTIFRLTVLLTLLFCQQNVFAQAGFFISYKTQDQVDDSNFIDLGTPEQNNAVVLEGNPIITGRFDYINANIVAGLFKVTKTKAIVTYSADEHAQILRGIVKMTVVDTGVSKIYGPGDAYFVTKGTKVVWDVYTPFLLKSFVNIF